MGSEGKKVIHWVAWEKVIDGVEVGGLGVGSIKAKIRALLGRWWWKFKIEKNALWVKVIQALP